MDWDWKSFFGMLSIGWGVITAWLIGVINTPQPPIEPNGILFICISYVVWLLMSAGAETLASSGFEF